MEREKKMYELFIYQYQSMKGCTDLMKAVHPRIYVILFLRIIMKCVKVNFYFFLKWMNYQI
jgi:hypothetical protein